jgi:hypothetical protein
VIDIEQHALRAFEQDACTRLAHLVEPLPHRLRELQHIGSDFTQALDQRGTVDRFLTEAGAQRVMVRAKPIEL